MPANNTTSFMDRVVFGRPMGWEMRDPKFDSWYKFEEADPFYWNDFVLEHRYLAVYAGIIYIITIYSLEWWMRDRPAYKLKMPLFLWNGALGIFSIIGFARMLPGMWYILTQPNGMYNSICIKRDITVPMGYWALLFVWSKYVELGDTVFIVLRKRPIVFLQWYHHLCTMMATWVLSPYMEPAQVCYIVMNFGVHSLMYPYFSLKAIGVHIPRRLANVITTLQLAQMIVGCLINLVSMYHYKMGHECERHPTSIQVFGLLYASFLLLFGKLFYESVLNPRASARSRKDGKGVKKLD